MHGDVSLCSSNFHPIIQDDLKTGEGSENAVLPGYVITVHQIFLAIPVLWYSSRSSAYVSHPYPKA